MPMTYTTLLAPKGTSGSIANWVGYTKLDLPVVLEEAQSLLTNILRVREMQAEWTLSVTQTYSNWDLPDRYLDPIGPFRDITNGYEVTPVSQGELESRRFYEQISGSLDTNPFHLWAGGNWFDVVEVNQRMTSGSTVTFSGATPFGVLDPNAAWRVEWADYDPNEYGCWLPEGVTATADAAGGGTGVTYTANVLIKGIPTVCAIFGNEVRFDVAAEQPTTYKHQYYRRPLLLSPTNQNNFLTDRYPKLLRVACMAASADFMEDDAQYQKHMQALIALIDSTVTMDDLKYRGASFGTDTP